MAAKISPTLIGGFVLGGIVLLVGALLLFGSGDLFKEKRRWVTYFDGSVGGLGVGAPVSFRGVRVGSVTDVVLLVDTRNLTARIPVYFEIEPDRIAWVGGQSRQSPEMAAQAGLRTKLSMQSFVTGQMEVELDILPDTPANLIGADPNVPEIPSAQSELDVLKKQVTDLPLREIAASVDRTVNNLDRLLTAPEMRDTLRSLASINEEVQPLLRELTATAQSVRQTSDQATASLRSVDGQVKTTLSDMRQLTQSTRGDLRTTLRSADQALQQAKVTLASIDGMVADNSQSREDIESVLSNLAQASNALKSFADNVERDPNSLLLGR